MGILFENVIPFDIEEERRKTEEQKQRADEQKQRADEAEEKVIRLFIETHQELGASWETTLQKILEKFGHNEASAKKNMNLYWKM